MMFNQLVQGTWRDLLKEEMQKSYFRNLENDILEAMLRRQDLTPEPEEVFRAFNLCPYEKTRVVIIGQDPYLTPGLADGLAFSVHKGQRVPPSLLNIFKALKNDLGCYIPNNGCLEPWAEQGVLLLNSILTCTPEAGRNYTAVGWQLFTDSVVSILSQHERPLVFLLWGRFAQRKTKYIDRTVHLVLKHNHPSPIIAGNTFASCDHFSRTNMFLYETTPSVIDWQIPNI